MIGGQSWRAVWKQTSLTLTLCSSYNYARRASCKSTRDGGGVFVWNRPSKSVVLHSRKRLQWLVCWLRGVNRFSSCFYFQPFAAAQYFYTQYMVTRCIAAKSVRIYNMEIRCLSKWNSRRHLHCDEAEVCTKYRKIYFYNTIFAVYVTVTHEGISASRQSNPPFHMFSCSTLPVCNLDCKYRCKLVRNLTPAQSCKAWGETPDRWGGRSVQGTRADRLRGNKAAKYCATCWDSKVEDDLSRIYKRHLLRICEKNANSNYAVHMNKYHPQMYDVLRQANEQLHNAVLSQGSLNRFKLTRFRVLYFRILSFHKFQNEVTKKTLW